MRKEEIARENFDSLEDNELIEMYNNMADRFHMERIYENDEFEINEMLKGSTPWRIIRDLEQSDHYSTSDAYFYMSSFGLPESFGDPFGDNSPIDKDELFSYYLDNEFDEDEYRNSIYDEIHELIHDKIQEMEDDGEEMDVVLDCLEEIVANIIKSDKIQ